MFIEAAKILYKDYLKYKETASRSNSVHTNPQYNANIKLPIQNQMTLENEKKDKKEKDKCSC